MRHRRRQPSHRGQFFRPQQRRLRLLALRNIQRHTAPDAPSSCHPIRPHFQRMHLTVRPQHPEFTHHRLPRTPHRLAQIQQSLMVIRIHKWMQCRHLFQFTVRPPIQLIAPAVPTLALPTVHVQSPARALAAVQRRNQIVRALLQRCQRRLDLLLRQQSTLVDEPHHECRRYQKHYVQCLQFERQPW